MPGGNYRDFCSQNLAIHGPHSARVSKERRGDQVSQPGLMRCMYKLISPGSATSSSDRSDNYGLELICRSPQCLLIHIYVDAYVNQVN